MIQIEHFASVLPPVSSGHTWDLQGTQKNFLLITHSRLMYEFISNRSFPVTCFSVFTNIFCPSLVLLERFISVSFYTAYLCPLAVSCNYLYGFHMSLVLLCLALPFTFSSLSCFLMFFCVFYVFCLIFVIFCLCCFWTKNWLQFLASSYLLQAYVFLYIIKNVILSILFCSKIQVGFKKKENWGTKSFNYYLFNVLWILFHDLIKIC